MGPGSHVGFPISANNKNLVYDHPMNISAKFDSNLFCGFRKKDEIKVITKLPNSEQSYKGKVKTYNYINRQNQSTTGKL